MKLASKLTHNSFLSSLCVCFSVSFSCLVSLVRRRRSCQTAADLRDDDGKKFKRPLQRTTPRMDVSDSVFLVNGTRNSDLRDGNRALWTNSYKTSRLLCCEKTPCESTHSTPCETTVGNYLRDGNLALVRKKIRRRLPQAGGDGRPGPARAHPQAPPPPRETLALLRLHRTKMRPSRADKSSSQKAKSQ